MVRAAHELDLQSFVISFSLAHILSLLIWIVLFLSACSFLNISLIFPHPHNIIFAPNTSSSTSRKPVRCIFHLGLKHFCGCNLFSQRCGRFLCFSFWPGYLGWESSQERVSFLASNSEGILLGSECQWWLHSSSARSRASPGTELAFWLMVF